MRKTLARPAVVAGLIALCLAALSAAPASASTLPTGFRDTVVPFEGTGPSGSLEEPTNIRFAPNGKVFIAEKTGYILVYENREDPTPEIFADLRTDVFDKFDRGLLGLAIDPNFPARPYVYALYTYDHLLGEEAPAPKWGEPNHTGDECNFAYPEGVDACPVSGRLVRLEAVGNHAVAEKVLVEGWCQQDLSHSIGDLQFGPEGDLYASGGDGASFEFADWGQYGWPQLNVCGDPPGQVGEKLSPPDAEGGALRSQNMTLLNGGIIRVDPDTGEGVPGNPLAGSADANSRRIVAKGFRNPFRFGFDPETSEIYVDNVGANTWEEIDHFSPSAERVFNSGWPCYEGPERDALYEVAGLSVCASLYANPGSTAMPFLYYNHSAPVAPGDSCPREAGSAIAGIAFTHEAPYPAPYDNALFFADAVRGCIYVMMRSPDGHPDPQTAQPFLSEGGHYPGVDLEIGPEGDLYYVKLAPDGSEVGGTIHRISYDPDAPFAKLKVSPHPWGQLSQVYELDASETIDPGGEPLTYKWDLDGNGTFETTGGATQTVQFNVPENVTVSVRVSSAKGSSVAHERIYPEDTPPKPEVELPNQSIEWSVGEQIHYAGYATDAEDAPGEGELPSSDLYWRLRMLHCPGGSSQCHAHPLGVLSQEWQGDFTVPDHEYPAHIEIELIATDSRGLSASKTRTFDPRTVGLSIHSSPSGIAVAAGGGVQTTPIDLPAIANEHVALSAPATVEKGGITYRWTGWSDGGARTHSVLADHSATYTAEYEPVIPVAVTPPPPGAGSGGGEAPPSASLIERPPKRGASATARFSFQASQPGSRFECSLDGGPFKSCRSPRVYRHLAVGKHLLKVRAVAAGGTGAPVTYRWRVLAGSPKRG